MYTPEEFAWAMKKRGYVIHIDSARKYVGKIGKEFYTEDDFPDLPSFRMSMSRGSVPRISWSSQA